MVLLLVVFCNRILLDIVSRPPSFVVLATVAAAAIYSLFMHILHFNVASIC